MLCVDNQNAQEWGLWEAFPLGLANIAWDDLLDIYFTSKQIEQPSRGSMIFNSQDCKENSAPKETISNMTKDMFQSSPHERAMLKTPKTLQARQCSELQSGGNGKFRELPHALIFDFMIGQ